MQETNKTSENINETPKEVNETSEGNKKSKLSPGMREFLSWVKIIVIAVVIAFVINNFVIINANVPTGSMESTIMVGDRMIGLRTAYWFKSPERGQIVIFKYPDDEKQTFVKRIIGLPGETITIKDAHVYVNDSKTPLKENYLNEKWEVGNGDEEPLVFKVPKDSYFCMGDNRNVSHDARFWENKYVHKSKIIAKAEFVYWPWDHRKILQTAKY